MLADLGPHAVDERSAAVKTQMHVTKSFEWKPRTKYEEHENELWIDVDVMIKNSKKKILHFIFMGKEKNKRNRHLTNYNLNKQG